ncbi:MAG: sulfite exporter TauE/SafE family protein [Erysipelotrichales bacterium]|nr:sulfite exporter TauE/SafE family protein [Erysipelotrichales bacterium]
MNYIIVFISALLGGFTQTVTGFGSGIVIMLFLPYILPIMQASALNVMVTVVLNVILVVKYRKFVNYRMIWIPSLISFAISTVVIYIGTGLDTNLMKMIFALFLIVLAIYFIFFSDKIKLKADLPTVITCAMLAGAANGLFGIGGPPMALYFLTITNSKEEYIGTTQVYFLLTSLYTTLIRIMNNVIDEKIVMLILPGLIGILIGEFVGIRVVDRISHEKMKRLMYMFLAFSGVVTFIQCL